MNNKADCPIASNELHSAFKSLLSTPSQRAVLATIAGESLTVAHTVPLTSNFDHDLRSINNLLKPNEAQYILLRVPDNPLFTAVTYVPDIAPVRQKMLFASTRLTLTRELGTEHFGDSFFTTTATEITPDGWKSHLKHVSAEAPLTQEEQNLVGIREAEASEVGGTARRGAGYGRPGGKQMPSEGIVPVLKEIGTGDLVVVKIADESKFVLASKATGVEPSHIASNLDTDEPRYSYYGYEFDGETKVIFIYTCPTASKIRHRMIYASSRRSAEVLCTDEAGVPLAKKVLL